MNRRLLIVPLMFLVAAGCASRGGLETDPMSEDERISAEVLRVLADDDEIVAEDLRVETRDGVVVVTGIQPSLDHVRRVLGRVSRVRGVKQVVNRIRVGEAGRGRFIFPQPSQSFSP